MTRPYTGTKDGAAKGKRAGLEQFVIEVAKLSDGALWNNGTYVNRNMRGKTTLSVHATGRATDMSYRKMETKGKPNGRVKALETLDILLANWRYLHIECVLDYFPQPHGRGWRCDRAAWQDYKTKAITGAPGGDWLHIEIGPKFADDAAEYKTRFEHIRNGTVPPPKANA
jgi:hypothetical protein